MSQAPKTFEEALAAFEALEYELGLPEWKIKGICAWKLQRHYMFRAYREHLGLMDVAHPETQRLRKSRARMIWDFPKPFLFRNPFFMAGCATQRVIIPHARKRDYYGARVDPISYPAWRPPHDQTATVLDKTNPLNPTLLPGAPSFEILARLAWIRRQAVRVRLNSKDHHIIKELSWRLLGETDSSVVESRFRKVVKSFIGLRSVFTAFLKRTRPNHLYVVVSYGCEAPIAAARDLGIETVEFQHGSIGRGHAGYDFKSWQNVPYFPDRLLAFGADWFREIHFPKNCTIEPVGYPSLEDIIGTANQEIARHPRQLLALSQGPIARQILHHAASFCAKRPEWTVVIRPHPSENPDHLRLQMAGMTTTSNWRIENELGLHEQTAASSVVFGVNSTALVEALLAGCRVALLDTANIAEYFHGLAADGHATKVKNGEELAEIVDDLPSGSARGYFAEPVDDIVSHVEGHAP